MSPNGTLSGLKLESDGKVVKFTQTMDDIFDICKRMDNPRRQVLIEYLTKLLNS